MKEPWIVFYLNGKEICSMTIRGCGQGEITETANLLAYEHNTTADAISWKIETR